MRLTRTKEFQFGWLCVFPFVGVLFLLIFFVLLGSNFVLQPGISVNVPVSRFTLAPQMKQQVISITGGSASAIYFRDQRTTLDQLGPLLDAAHKEGRSLIIKADRQISIAGGHESLGMQHFSKTHQLVPQLLFSKPHCICLAGRKCLYIPEELL